MQLRHLRYFVKIVEAGSFSRAAATIHVAQLANLLRTVDRDPKRLSTLHAHEIERITSLAKPRSASRLNLDAPDAYAWSLYHLLQNEDVIKNVMFPITYYQANGAAWTPLQREVDGGQPGVGDFDALGIFVLKALES
jgi:hypothetical protein